MYDRINTPELARKHLDIVSKRDTRKYMLQIYKALPDDESKQKFNDTLKNALIKFRNKNPNAYHIKDLNDVFPIKNPSRLQYLAGKEVVNRRFDHLDILPPQLQIYCDGIVNMCGREPLPPVGKRQSGNIDPNIQRLPPIYRSQLP